MLSSGLIFDLNKFCYSSEMARSIISFHGLYKQGFTFSLIMNVVVLMLFIIMFFILKHYLVMVYMKLCRL